MKSIILAVALVAAVIASPPPADSISPNVEILENEFVKQPDNSFTYKFLTGNGITVEQSGQLKEVVGEDNKPQNVVVVKGSYSYPDADGKPETISYFADETGYHAEGKSIPKVVSS